MKKLLKLLFIGIIASSLIACTNKTQTESTVSASPTPETTSTPEVTSETSSAKYVTGTYTKSAQGKNGEITLEVVLSESEIVSINVVSESETPELGGVALSTMLPAIIEAQSTDVDSVTGATITSTAIIEIVNSILSEASK